VIITASAQGSELVELSGELARPRGGLSPWASWVSMYRGTSITVKRLDLRLSMSYGPGRYDVEYEERGHDYPVAYVRWTESATWRLSRSRCWGQG
jgi:polar amino acid transport system substrate-binding protein